MESNLHAYRKNYDKGVLTKESVNKNPFQQFHTWFCEVERFGVVEETNAMTLTTLGKDGFPKGRVVLLKRYDENGFYFYTNYKSEKGVSIDNHPNVSLSFFWPSLERQILIKGVAEKTGATDSTNYFLSRPRGSQLGALVSDQSAVVKNRKVLETKLKTLEEQYKNKEIPKPKHWGGYLIVPVVFEFWQGRPNRLHDRIRYSLKQESWEMERLAP